MNPDTSAKPPVVIFAGGLGTRLGGDFSSIPKPLVHVGPFPVLLHIIFSYLNEGFSRFIVCTGYKSSEFQTYFSTLSLRSPYAGFKISDLGVEQINKSVDFRDLGALTHPFSVEFVDTGINTLTGGRLAQIENLISTDIFLCTYGDGLTNQSIHEVINFHKNTGSLATLTAFHPPSRFGEVEIDENGFVISFQEKPLSKSFVNGGFFVFSKDVFAHLDKRASLEEGLLSHLSRMKVLSAFRSEACWQMMDTPREVNILNELYYSGKAFWLQDKHTEGLTN